MLPSIQIHLIIQIYFYMNGKKSKVECSECGGVVLAVSFERQRGEVNNMFSHQNDILT